MLVRFFWIAWDANKQKHKECKGTAHISHGSYADKEVQLTLVGSMHVDMSVCVCVLHFSLTAVDVRVLVGI